MISLRLKAHVLRSMADGEYTLKFSAVHTFGEECKAVSVSFQVRWVAVNAAGTLRL
jgi:hypothetical protein